MNSARPVTIIMIEDDEGFANAARQFGLFFAVMQVSETE